MGLKVSRVQIDVYEPKASGICAEATVVIEDELAIHKVLVIQGERGLFVGMPNTGHTKMVNNARRFEDLVHPLSTELGDLISKEVLEKYNSYKDTK